MATDLLGIAEVERIAALGCLDARTQSDLGQFFTLAAAAQLIASRPSLPSTDRAEFRKYVDKTAWESEVWCADHLTHMIHYNGERFLGPNA